MFSKEFGGNFDVSEVKTDWNCLFNAFAFSDVSVKSLPFSLRGETPEESRFMALIIDQSLIVIIMPWIYDFLKIVLIGRFLS